jgi:hypothetical protein
MTDIKYFKKMFGAVITSIEADMQGHKSLHIEYCLNIARIITSTPNERV